MKAEKKLTIKEGKEPLAKCEGKFDFCWPWTGTPYTNGSRVLEDKIKGLSFMKMTSTADAKLTPTRNVAFLRYGALKGEVVIVNYCPFCGADYEALGRL